MSLSIDGNSNVPGTTWTAAEDGTAAPPLSTQLQDAQACAADPARQQADLATIAERNALLAEAYAEADRTGDASLREQADALAKLYHDQGMSALANDVYHYTQEACSTPPVGWSRASENPEVLARYGLSPSDLAPADSGFRADLYIPDPAIHGPDAVPVLAFKGTDVTSAEDWANNFTQGVGGRTDFYDRAMDLATRVQMTTGGDFEITGHSLGGGMASAASAVTGASATTFNAAGLHEDTARDFLAASGRAPHDVDTLVTAYHVEGEVLTGIQEAASGISPHHADQLASVIQGAIGLAESAAGRAVLDRLGVEVPDLSGLRNADGSDLRSMPTAAGESITIPAVNADGTPRPDIVPLGGEDGLIARAEHVVDIAESYIGPVVRAGQLPGKAVEAAGDAANGVLDASGRLASQAMGAGGDLFDRVTDAGGAVIDNVMDAGGGLARGTLQASGQAVARGLDAAGDLASGTLAGAGHVAGGVLDKGGDIAGGAIDLGGRIGSRVVENVGDAAGGLLSGIGGALPGPLGRVLERGGDAIADGAARVADSGRNAVDRVASKVNDTLDAAGDAVSRHLQNIGTTAGNFLDDAGRVAGAALDRAGNVVGNALDRAGDAAARALDRAGDLGANVAQRIGDGVSRLLDRGGDTLSWLGDRIGGGLKALGVAGSLTSPIGATATAAGVAHAGIVAARDPVLGDAVESIGEMTYRHGGDVVDNGMAHIVGEQEAALEARLGR